ncbi:hypothetical protein BGZ68_005259 [Mortierella alpina]|nr:hypothetical protein BGZ68_005259 [Mortierella alpina]
MAGRNHGQLSDRSGSCQGIGDALICPEESPSPCQFTAKFVDTQSTTNELGFKSEFSLSAKGGASGALEFEAKVTLSEERRFSRQFNEGKELTYTFHVEKGKACRLSQVSYRARCQGVLYDVPSSRQTVLCPVLVRLDRQFSFNEPHAWFKDPEYPDWFHMVRKVNEFMDPVPSGLYLWSFRVKNNFPPTSCADLIQDAEYRPMTEKTRDPNSESFLVLDNGKSISAVSCIYSN